MVRVTNTSKAGRSGNVSWSKSTYGHSALSSSGGGGGGSGSSSSGAPPGTQLAYTKDDDTKIYETKPESPTKYYYNPRTGTKTYSAGGSVPSGYKEISQSTYQARPGTATAQSFRQDYAVSASDLNKPQYQAYFNQIAEQQRREMAIKKSGGKVIDVPFSAKAYALAGRRLNEGSSPSTVVMPVEQVEKRVNIRPVNDSKAPPVSIDFYREVQQSTKSSPQQQQIISDNVPSSAGFENRVRELQSRESAFFGSEGFQRISKTAGIITQPGILYGQRYVPYEDRSFIGKASQNVVTGVLSWPIALGGALPMVGEKIAATVEGLSRSDTRQNVMDEYVRTAKSKEFTNTFNPLTPEGLSTYITAAGFGLLGVAAKYGKTGQANTALKTLAKDKPNIKIKGTQYSSPKATAFNLKGQRIFKAGDVEVIKDAGYKVSNYQVINPRPTVSVAKLTGKSSKGTIVNVGDTQYSNLFVNKGSRGYYVRSKTSGGKTTTTVSMIDEPVGRVGNELYRGDVLLKKITKPSSPDIVFGETLSQKEAVIQPLSREARVYRGSSVKNTLSMNDFLGEQSTTVRTSQGISAKKGKYQATGVGIGVEDTVLNVRTKSSAADIFLGKDKILSIDVKPTEYKLVDYLPRQKNLVYTKETGGILIEKPAQSVTSSVTKLNQRFFIEYVKSPKVKSGSIWDTLFKRGKSRGKLSKLDKSIIQEAKAYVKGDKFPMTKSEFKSAWSEGMKANTDAATMLKNAPIEISRPQALTARNPFIKSKVQPLAVEFDGGSANVGGLLYTKYQNLRNTKPLVNGKSRQVASGKKVFTNLNVQSVANVSLNKSSDAFKSLDKVLNVQRQSQSKSSKMTELDRALKIESKSIQQQQNKQVQQQQNRQVQQQQQSQAQAHTQLNIQTNVLTQTGVPPPPLSIPLISPVGKSTKKLLGLSITEPGYHGYVKRRQAKKGKGSYQSRGYVKVTDEPMSKEGAIATAMQALDRYTNRSGYVKKANKPAKSRGPALSPSLASKFRRNKKNPNVFTEKTGFAIDSWQEKQGIPYEAARQRRRQKLGLSSGMRTSSNPRNRGSSLFFKNARNKQKSARALKRSSSFLGKSKYKGTEWWL